MKVLPGGSYLYGNLHQHLRGHFHTGTANMRTAVVLSAFVTSSKALPCFCLKAVNITTIRQTGKVKQNWDVLGLECYKKYYFLL